MTDTAFITKFSSEIKKRFATLRDGCYLIDDVIEGKFIKQVNGEIFYIEPEIVRPIYKVSEIAPPFLIIL